jgi:hypothetical protein
MPLFFFLDGSETTGGLHAGIDSTPDSSARYAGAKQPRNEAF